MGILIQSNKVISAGGKILYRKDSSPLELPNLKLYLSATRMAQQADNTNVSNFIDFSGYGYNASQATSGNQPTFQTNEFGINAGIKFDGTNDYLSLTYGALDLFRNINQFTIQIVVKRSVISTSSPVYQSQNNSGTGVRAIVQFQADGTIYAGMRKDDSVVYNIFSNIQVNDLNPHIIQYTLDSSGVAFLYVDGNLVGSVNSGVTFFVNTPSFKNEVGANTQTTQYGTAIINGISINQSYSDPSTIQAQYRGYLQRGYL